MIDMALVHGPERGSRVPALHGSASYDDGLGGVDHAVEHRDGDGDLVANIFLQQEPLREDRLVQAVARLQGFGRSGREIRELVMAAMPGASAITTEEIGRFVWPAGIDPLGWDRFRTPAPGRMFDPSELPIEELVTLARQSKISGMSEGQEQDEAVLIAMRDACGLQRLRETSRNRCLTALAVARG